MHENEQHLGLTELERISVLETQYFQTKSDLGEIKEKLDQLLHLKSRGLGALWLIGLIIGSGFVGFIDRLSSILGKK